MSRSVEYWNDFMLTEKSNMATLSVYQPSISTTQTLLNDLSSTSKVARWRLMIWIVAVCAYAFDVVLDMAIATMEFFAAKASYGTIPWYVAKAKEFQYGDALSLVGNEWKYATVNTANQIIRLSAAQEGLGVVNLKVATISGGIKQPLTSPQYAAAKGYIDKIKPAGIKVNLINDNPDDLVTDLAINYDPLVLTSIGELISTPGVFPVEDAREAYLESLDFNGGYELMSLIDFIQRAQGVKSAYVLSASARYGTNAFAAFPQRYFPNAGYLTTHPLSTINYTASV